jgi:hypothetical protein
MDLPHPQDKEVKKTRDSQLDALALEEWFFRHPNMDVLG